jgi:hypothetical protein
VHGQAECFRERGQVAAARSVEERFQKAWERADVEIPGSCFFKSAS